MRATLVVMFLLTGCGGPIQVATADAGMEQPDEPAPVVPPPPTYRPLCITWGMTTTQVTALAGRPDYTGPLTGADPIYGDTLWRYDLACGDWFVTFKQGVVTARFGLAGGCNPAPASECPPG